MATTYAKAPLIELIAEVRWTPQGSTIVGPTTPQQARLPALFLGGTKQEEFYMHLGGVLLKYGFNRSERLSPPGMPFTLHQPVYRFKSEENDKGSAIYQVGYGMFSVHAVPPYHSWSKFLPFVKDGFEMLLHSRPEADLGQPFGQAILRYIDFFGEQLTQGLDVQSFLSRVFGISINFPEEITRSATSKDAKSLFTKVVFPVKIGDLTLSVGDGQFNNRPGVVLDWTVSSYAVPSNLEAMMRVFDSAYGLIHDLFIGLTRPLHDLMEPHGTEA